MPYPDSATSRLRAVTLLAVAATMTSATSLAATAKVESFSPQGTVKAVRQVAARFSEPMTPLGDPGAGVTPFVVDCAESGSGRWVDSRSWVYDFNRDLPGGVRCTFSTRTGLHTLSGAPVTAARFQFSTGGPAILNSNPSADEDLIDEEQAFVLVLDAAANDESILRHATFAVDGLPQPIGVRLLQGAEREAVLKAQWPDFLSGPTVVLQARQRFPNGHKLKLIWGAGIATPNGVATEAPQILQFRTRPAFTINLSCERENAHSNCIPLTPIILRFSSAVAWEQARAIFLSGPNDKRWEPDAPSSPDPLVDSVRFRGPFPEEVDLVAHVPKELRDDAGRIAVNANSYPKHFKTAGFPPLAKFAARFGIIEAKAEPALPVTLRNLEPELLARLQQVTGNGLTASTQRIAPNDIDAIVPALDKIAGARRIASIFADAPKTAEIKELRLPKPNGAKAFEVIGIPFSVPGLYLVEIASPRLGASLLGTPSTMYVASAALVTNLGVHFKWGRESSLVWVTTLDGAQPVAKARISIRDCNGTTYWRGETDDHGIARVDSLPSSAQVPNCWGRTSWPQADPYDDQGYSPALSSLREGLTVVAQTDDDMSFVCSGWTSGIESWRFGLPEERWSSPVVQHTILDRPLYRAGEVVHMKHVLRKQTLAGFANVAADQRPTTLLVQHLGSDEKYELPLPWDEHGLAESTWEIPKSAKLGRYTLTPTRGVEPLAPAGEFQVQEFRVPLMRGVIHLPTEPQVAVPDVAVGFSLQYLSGGPAAKLPVTLRAQLQQKFVAADPGFERFTFANGAVSEGLTRRNYNEEVPDTSKPQVHQRTELVLDDAGSANTTIEGLPPADKPRELLAEMEYRDPNGESQTVASAVTLWPANTIVGISGEAWVQTGPTVRLAAVVLDLEHRPMPGVAVHVDLLQRRRYETRKRLVGGFYAYEGVVDVRRIGDFCDAVTDEKGLVRCESAPTVGGNLILQASVTDAGGHVSVSHVDVWGGDPDEDWMFDQSSSDRIDLLPEKRRYEPGETARFQVRMPFREATALVTTEREGVLDAWTTHLSGNDPVIEVPVKDSFAPNMFVSVLAVRGRAGDVQATAFVDLGRPALKLGIAAIDVGWRAHELDVKVHADREVYRVRDRAKVEITVRNPDGSPPAPGSEVALAAVDEGLLELRPNRSWDILDALMGRRGYALRTASAQLQIVGKRHFGLKALPQGGGGGRRGTRELFDTLLSWQGRLRLDDQGNATTEVPLNDSLTSFRIVAVATAGDDRFGSGSTSIRSTQDLMLLSGIAPIAREGDRGDAEVSVRNTTTRAMDVTVSVQATGLTVPLPVKTVSLGPGEAKPVTWPVEIPAAVDSLRYTLRASEAGGAADEITITQRVLPAVPIRTYQATLFQLDKPIEQAVEPPADAVPGKGGIRVTATRSLSGSLAPLRQWMRDYPYSCLEQRVSRAVALHDTGLWNEITSSLPTYLDRDGLLKYFPTLETGSDTLTAYVLTISHAAQLDLPATTQRRMADGLRGFINGSATGPSRDFYNDLTLRKLAAIDALTRLGQGDAKLIASLRLEPNLWPTSAVIDWWSILLRLDKIPDRQRQLREVEQILRSRLNLQGTQLGFSTEERDRLWWLMTDADVNAVRLALLLSETEQWRDELPRLVQGALRRQRQGHWDSTVANAWGVLAVERFSQAFETQPVAGATDMDLGDQHAHAAWSSADQVQQDFPWPPAAATLALKHSGDGAPWVTVQTMAAIPLQQPLASGYRITRTVRPIEAQQRNGFRRGDLVRVHLDIEAQADMTWVVVDDPIPAGASHVGTGLARDSVISTQEEADATVSPAFVERPAASFRAYYSFVPKGTFSIEYTLRLNQAGHFALPPTRVEALYAAEMFGEAPNADVEVAP